MMKKAMIDKELLQATMKPSEFFEKMSRYMQRLENKLVEVKYKENEEILALYRKLISI